MKNTVVAGLLSFFAVAASAVGSTAAAPSTGAVAAKAPAPEAPPPPPPVDESSCEWELNQCKKFPAGKRILKVNLKPDSEIADVIAWFSSISCAQFIIPGKAFLQGRKVTILATQLLTPEEAYRLFLGALESVNLKVEPAGTFLRIAPASSHKGEPAR